MRSATLSKKRLWHRCFPVHLAKFLRTPSLTEDLWWLLLDYTYVLYRSTKIANYCHREEGSKEREIILYGNVPKCGKRVEDFKILI